MGNRALFSFSLCTSLDHSCLRIDLLYLVTGAFIIELSACLDHAVGCHFECHCSREVMGQSQVLKFFHLLNADGLGEQVERVTWNGRVEMNAAEIVVFITGRTSDIFL